MYSVEWCETVKHLLNFFTLFAWMLLNGVDGLTLAPVFWNSSNPMFKPSINSPVIEVRLRDEIDFVCPFDASNGSDVTSGAEYYVIYQVSKAEFDSCLLSAIDRRPLLIVNCNAPEAKRRFTVIFEPYQSIPNVPEYKTGSTYYYTTTSTGRQDGLSNTKNGACLDFNMKLAIYICCPTTVAPRTIVSSRSTTTTTMRSLGGSPPSSVPSDASADPKSSNANAPTPQMPSTSRSSTTTTTTTSSLSTTTTKSGRASSSSSAPASVVTWPTIRIDAKTSSSSSSSSSSLSLIDRVSTTKITQLPQPSYQQTVNGGGQGPQRTGSRPLVIAAAVAASLLLLPLTLCFGRT